MTAANVSTEYSLVTPEISLINGKPTITSRQIAEDFNKSHKHVIDAIEEAEVSNNFRELNFQFSEYSVDGQTRKYKQYTLTRNGFTIIAMGYNGKKAMAFKEAYIEAFDTMEEQLRTGIKTITADQLITLRNQMSNVTRYMKHSSASLAQNLYRKMKDELGYDKIENMPEKQYTQAINWLAPYQIVAHQVYDLTNGIERKFITCVKDQNSKTTDLYDMTLDRMGMPQLEVKH